MTKSLSKDQTVSLEEVVISDAYEITAVFNILERKGLITRKEVLGEQRLIDCIK